MIIYLWNIYPLSLFKGRSRSDKKFRRSKGRVTKKNSNPYPDDLENEEKESYFNLNESISLFKSNPSKQS